MLTMSCVSGENILSVVSLALLLSYPILIRSIDKRIVVRVTTRESKPLFDVLNLAERRFESVFYSPQSGDKEKLPNVGNSCAHANQSFT